MSILRMHSKEAWAIAEQYSYALGSETRDLAAQIDNTIRSLTEERDLLKDRLNEACAVISEAVQVQAALTARVGELSALENMLLLCGELGGPTQNEPLEKYLRRLIDHSIELERDVSYWKSRAQNGDG